MEVLRAPAVASFCGVGCGACFEDSVNLAVRFLFDLAAISLQSLRHFMLCGKHAWIALLQ